ncbi:MAG: hypothetical protein M3Y21_05650, partial [Candidatus Eremiobacteraeota bacterium]|nr:hypothetical protein [Candidatus Eremiobacteraeota bacterium]
MPAADVNGVDNSDGHEVDLYSVGAAKTAHFKAYNWDRVAQTITAYDYVNPNARCPASCQNAGVVAIAVSNFHAQRYNVDQIASVSPFIAAVLSKITARPKNYFVNYGYADPLIQGGNYEVLADVAITPPGDTKPFLQDKVGLTMGVIPSKDINVVVGYYT